MPNRLFAFERDQTNPALARLFAYDTQGSGWSVVVTGLPDLPATACWDGGELYMAGSRIVGGVTSIRLYRLSGTTWIPCAGGSVILSNGSQTINSMISDGNFVYMVGDGKFFRYDKAANTVSQIGLTFTPRGKLVWDYSSNIYFVDNFICARYSLITGASTLMTTPPTGSTGTTTAYSNGYLYAWTQTNRYRMPVTGSVWETFPGGGANGDEGQGQYDDRTSYVIAGLGSDGFLKYDFVGGVGLGATGFANVGATLYPVKVAVFEIPIQAVFTFLEKDGITPQLGTEPLGGTNARYFSGQLAGPFPFTLKCASPRQAVQLAVVPDANVDVVASVEIAPAAGGPWAQEAQLGAFTAGQVKPYYMRFAVPNGSMPALKKFSLVATSL